jgi:hypothetical protein
MQKFSFQSMENSRITIAADRTAADAEDPDHWDKLPQNTRAASATGKASSSRHFTQDWSDDDSDEDCRMFICPTPLAMLFLPGAKLGKKFIGVILLNSPVSFRIFKSIAAFTMGNYKFSLVSFDTIPNMLAPPLLPTTPLAHVFPMPSSAIPDEEVVDDAPLNQGPPPAGIRIGKKRGVRPQPEPTQKRQKVGAPNPKKPRPVASG